MKAALFSWFRSIPGKVLSQGFRLDIRSLMLFRIALGLLLMADVLHQWNDLGMFYTDSGVLPRSIALAVFRSGHRLWSFHMWNGSLLFQQALFCCEFLAAFGLLIGYRTPLMTLLCWVLVNSHQVRNPLILAGGDMLLRLVLFWSLFLPLGAYGSLDCRSEENKAGADQEFSSLGTAGFLLQICFLYWFSVSFKTDPAWHAQGTAVAEALRYEPLARPAAASLLRYPKLLTLLTHGTIGLERWGPLLLFSPLANRPLRLVAVMLFIAFHMTLGLCLDLGIFSYVAVISWLAILPSDFWDLLLGFWNRPRLAALRTRALHLASAFLRRFPIPRRQITSSRLWCSLWEVQAAAAFFILYIFAWNLTTTDPDRYQRQFRKVAALGYLACIVRLGILKENLMQHRETALFAIVALGASIAAWSKCSVVRPIQVQPACPLTDRETRSAIRRFPASLSVSVCR